MNVLKEIDLLLCRMGLHKVHQSTADYKTRLCSTCRVWF